LIFINSKAIHRILYQSLPPCTGIIRKSIGDVAVFINKKFKNILKMDSENKDEVTPSSGNIANAVLPAVPTVQDVYLNSKYFIVDKVEECINCFMAERNDGWDGYKLAIKYFHGAGYNWELSGFWAANSIVQQSIEKNPELFTKDKSTAFKLLGTCPKCSAELFNDFSWSLHDVQKCGSQKRAVSPRSEWA
jgi:hypothetical protein